jgi:hypothetical protein
MVNSARHDVLMYLILARPELVENLGGEFLVRRDVDRQILPSSKLLAQ